MKRLSLVLILVFAGSGAWADNWSGDEQWRTTESKADVAWGFKVGYFEAIRYLFPWTNDDMKALGMTMLVIDSYDLAKAVDRFYEIPENKALSNVQAMRICLERMIARTPDGPRLLGSIGVKLDLVASR